MNYEDFIAGRKWGHPIYSPFFYGGFLLPYIFLAYTLDISVAEGKYGRYKSCPYLLLRRYEFVGHPELAVRK